MTDSGLREVANPSELFLGERNAKAPGAAVFAGIEGTRPVLVIVTQFAKGTDDYRPFKRVKKYRVRP